jgi:hypothetical protein
MKLQLRNLEKGDEIEVAFATHDNRIWHACTIAYIDCDVIRAVTASGHQFIINRWDDDKYRLPKLKVAACA